MSNNAPYCTLELTKEEAELLLKSSESNMQVALTGMQMGRGAMRAETLRELVANTELFSSIRKKLINQGVQTDES